VDTTPREPLLTMNAIDDIYTSLNSEQRTAVFSDERFLLILAGAGAGKTRTITIRIARLLAEQKVFPQNILALTFTNKAAREMRERIDQLLGEHISISLGTFHSFGARFLRRYARTLGLSQNFVIYDTTDSVQLLQQEFPDHPRATIVGWSKLISLAKDRALTPEDSLEHVNKNPEFRQVYASYQKRLHNSQAVDFGDLILRPILALREYEEIREAVHRQCTTILVDEYQDTNYAQFIFLQLLLGEKNSLCVVGDDDQSIYSFRGAEIRNIIDFPHHFTPCSIFRLETNYRSTDEILNFAGNSISHNSDRHTKTLKGTQKTGEKPQFALLNDDVLEARFCIQKIIEEYRSGTIAIFYRTNAQSRLFESQLAHEHIPYQIVGTLRFWDREEIKDLMSVFSLFLNPRDVVSFMRIINKPSRKIGAKSIQTIIDISEETGNTLLEATKNHRTSAKKAQVLLELFDELPRYLNNCEKLSNLVQHILRQSGLGSLYAEHIKSELKQENIDEFMRLCDSFEPNMTGVQALLEQFALDSVETEHVQDSRVHLMTIHKAKGLEFDHVFLTGMNEGLFPIRTYPEELEEERRLFYVACTRAQLSLTITSTQLRMVHGRQEYQTISRFMEEIDPSLYAQNRSTMPGHRVSHSWSVGEMVYHSEYGSGRVEHVELRYGEEYIRVSFFNGRRGEFVPKYVKDLVKLDG